jgi:hypothetical protein
MVFAIKFKCLRIIFVFVVLFSHFLHAQNKNPFSNMYFLNKTEGRLDSNSKVMSIGNGIEAYYETYIIEFNKGTPLYIHCSSFNDVVVNISNETTKKDTTFYEKSLLGVNFSGSYVIPETGKYTIAVVSMKNREKAKYSLSILQDLFKLMAFPKNSTLQDRLSTLETYSIFGYLPICDKKIKTEQGLMGENIETFATNFEIINRFQCTVVKGTTPPYLETNLFETTDKAKVLIKIQELKKEFELKLTGTTGLKITEDAYSWNENLPFYTFTSSTPSGLDSTIFTLSILVSKEKVYTIIFKK